MTLKVFDETVYLAESKPTGETNCAFPDGVLRENTIMNYNIAQNSDCSKFL